GVAMAALTLAIAATVGIGTMIHSFRHSVNQWLTTTLQAALYISLPGAHADSPYSFLDPLVLKRIASTPEVAAIRTTRWLRIADSKGFTNLVAFKPAPQSFASFQFTAGHPKQAWQAFVHQSAVLVSEPYAYHHHLLPGSTLTLHTDRGEHAFTVAGVYRSYSS